MKKRLLVALFLCLVALQAACAANNLSRAAVDGNLQMAKDSVAQGERINDIDRWGWTALAWAVYYGNFPVTKWLLEQGADPNIKTTLNYGHYPEGTTPLILAAAYGHADAVEALLEKKADPNVIYFTRALLAFYRTSGISMPAMS